MRSRIRKFVVALIIGFALFNTIRVIGAVNAGQVPFLHGVGYIATFLFGGICLSLLVLFYGPRRLIETDSFSLHKLVSYKRDRRSFSERLGVDEDDED